MQTSAKAAKVSVLPQESIESAQKICPPRAMGEKCEPRDVPSRDGEAGRRLDHSLQGYKHKYLFNPPLGEKSIPPPSIYLTEDLRARPEPSLRPSPILDSQLSSWSVPPEYTLEVIPPVVNNAKRVGSKQSTISGLPKPRLSHLYQPRMHPANHTLTNNTSIPIPVQAVSIHDHYTSLDGRKGSTVLMGMDNTPYAYHDHTGDSGIKDKGRIKDTKGILAFMLRGRLNFMQAVQNRLS